ncbi:MAG TPA: ergothioneine biosynthesis protein EgtB [Allosphingosinicella sp.]|jgi:ergothioneine biosynthesis protein EgtB|uniref:ergothioneine biosynthesis protein EgtB n=1 Tax=Allosphingosinicella sp. TaxID=2823234 RepID=UPI002F27648E
MATLIKQRHDRLGGRFRAVRALSRAIAAPLSDADATIQPHPDASPAKWHLAHTSWFFETFVLRDHLPGYRAFDPAYAYLFNSYYDGEGARQPRDRRGMLSRPALTDIYAYRDHVDRALEDALAVLPQAARELVELGLQHEQQHQELMLMDLLAAFAENPLAPVLWSGAPETAGAPATTIGGIAGRAGIVEIGHDGDGFAFDCEGPRHPVLIRAHELADRLVTNGEWLRFIEEGGYTRPEHWLADGWTWVRAERIEAPLYWRRDGDAWFRFGLDGLHPVALAEPVCHISYYEADAFARWAGARLPAEAEWEVAAAGLDPDTGNQLDGAGPVRPKPAIEADRARQMFGDVWEWTASPFTAYPGYKPVEGTVGEYNGKFMCGQFVLKGGSCATPRGHVRASYRNFFYPHQRWMFAGLRLARDL